MNDLSELKRLAEAAKRAAEDFDAAPSNEVGRRLRETLQDLHELCYGEDILSLIERVERAEAARDALIDPMPNEHVWNFGASTAEFSISVTPERFVDAKAMPVFETSTDIEQQGYLRGIEEAAKVADQHASIALRNSVFEAVCLSMAQAIRNLAKGGE